MSGLKQTTGGERAGALCVLALTLASFALVPLVARLDPELAAMARLAHDTDPWGSPWYVHRVERVPGNAPVTLGQGSPGGTTTFVYKPVSEFDQQPAPGESLVGYLYSLGPNGVDDKGEGDDLLAEEFPQSRFPTSARVDRGQVLILGLAAALALLLVALRCSRLPRSERLWAELLRSLPIAAVPTLAALLFAYWDVSSTPGNRETLAQQWAGDAVLTPPSIALVGSAALLSGVLALSWRLTRAAPDQPEAVPQPPSAPPQGQPKDEADE